MLDQIKTRFEKTKEFISEHQTTAACVATGIVTWKLSHDVTLRAALRETTALSYEWGREHGALLSAQNIFLDFIEKQDLLDELETHLNNLK